MRALAFVLVKELAVTCVNWPSNKKVVLARVNVVGAYETQYSEKCAHSGAVLCN